MPAALPVLLALVTAPLAPAARGPDPRLQTVAEKTGHEETGRYAEIQALCPALAARAPARLRCFEWGRSPEGRPLLALAASSDGVLEPAAARRANRPVLLVLGGIHPGEIEGKDAGMAWLRDLALAEQGAVGEEEARAMLARAPSLAGELAAALARDPTLAGDPRRRLDFFRRRHPSWDERLNLYPILRLDRRR